MHLVKLSEKREKNFFSKDGIKKYALTRGESSLKQKQRQVSLVEDLTDPNYIVPVFYAYRPKITYFQPVGISSSSFITDVRI